MAGKDDDQRRFDLVEIEGQIAEIETMSTLLELEIQKKRIEIETERLTKDLTEYRRLEAEAEAGLLHERNDSYAGSAQSVPQSLNVDAKEFRPILQPAENNVQQSVNKQYPETNPEQSLFLNLAETMERITSQAELPPPPPMHFSGKPSDYIKFMNSFEVRVGSKNFTDAYKLSQLLMLVTGDAKGAIERFHGSVNGYVRALEVLKSRFGRPCQIVDSCLEIITTGNRIVGNKALQEFSDKLVGVYETLNDKSLIREADTQTTLKRIFDKLPPKLQDRWVMRLTGREEYDESYTPRLYEIVKFVEHQARSANHGVYNVVYNSKTSNPMLKTANTKYMSNNASKKGGPEARTLSTSASSPATPQEGITKSTSCYHCNGNHVLTKCPQFSSMTLRERQDVVKSKALCWGCLRHGHKRGKCRRPHTCDVCSKNHPTLLHFGKKPDKMNEHQVQTQEDKRAPTLDNKPDNATCNATQGNQDVIHSLVMPVLLSHSENPDLKIKVYALLDDQSNASFLSESIAQKLKIGGPEVQIQVKTLIAQNPIATIKVPDLVVEDMDSTVSIKLPKCYTQKNIPGSYEQIATKETISPWPHLEVISEELPPLDLEAEIGLLIGANCPQAMKPRQVIPGQDCDPYAIKTDLGWGVIGGIVDHESDFAGLHFVHRTTVKELSPLEVKAMFEREFIEDGPADAKISQHDKEFLSKLQDGVQQLDDGHFVLPLPFKGDNVQLPNNKVLAISRLNGLKKKLARKEQFFKDYNAFMANMIQKGYSERVPEENLSKDNGDVWYLPHHGVYHPKKHKIRVVFDCSAEYQGEILNKHLLQGPDLTNNLAGILTRFRKHPIGISCDIEACYYQVLVPENQRDFMRFLWFEDGDINKQPVEYRMTRHVFGATSSPGCANFALKETAHRIGKCFSQNVADFIYFDFYFDDGVTSVETVEEALKMIMNSHELCSKGGFHLRQYTSNNKDVVRQIPTELKTKNMQNINLQSDTMPLERTLGMEWCTETDTLQFHVNFKENPPTRRGILSTVSSLFDPLGLVAPAVLEGKKIVQDLCRSGLDWDTPITEDMKVRWENWKEQLKALEHLTIPRCYKPTDFHGQEPAFVELHHFSDASLRTGYGQCSYLRLIDETGSASTSLVAAKSRVNPSKAVTVPRLELTAALTSVKVSIFLRRELQYENLREIFWTDSQVVLGYIGNEAKRFHVFVSNRVQKIRDSTSPNQWHHVATNENPADLASRGLPAMDLSQSELWWNGPAFLAAPGPIEFETTQEVPELNSNDPEVRKVVTSMATRADTEPEFDILKRLERFSSWHRTKRAVAVWLRFKKGLKDRTIKLPTAQEKMDISQSIKTYVPVNVQEMEIAETVIIKLVQAKAFGKEIRCLKAKATQGKPNRKWKAKWNISKLDPYLDETDILRVGGRIKRSNLPREMSHPVLLPKRGHMITLIVGHYHTRVHHSGRGITLNELRCNGYWIISCRSAVTSLLRKCITCKKLRENPCGQKMGNLPPDRLESAPPFTNSSVDYFGPYYVKIGRSSVKRYGALFTCLCSRAIHVEVSHALDTSSFLNAYRRFVGRRGPVKRLRSDHGTNFVGASSELAHALKEMNTSKVKQELLKDNCDFVTFDMSQPPYSSHMNGAVERMIRSVRNVLSALLTTHGSQLDDELLNTFMVEAEAIVNSRPLTYVDTADPDSPLPLSPSQILTLKPDVVLAPPGVFLKQDMYCTRRWRRVQYLADQFWRQWRKEFLPQMQERRKWENPKFNLGKGDIVLLMDDDLPRCKWPLARVSEVFPGKDGLVRKVKIIAKGTVYERAIHKLVFLLKTDGDDPRIPAEEPKK